MAKQNSNKLYQLVIDKLENLKVELFENSKNIESIRLISASLDNLLIKLIKTNGLQEEVEEELRLLINHLNAIVYNRKINKNQYLRISIKYLILKAKQHIQ
jgi:hypothetical protein